MRKECTLISNKIWSKYSQWRSFSESKPVPCTNSFRKNDCPYWLVVWQICLNFMLCFLLVPLYASTTTPSKGTCAKPYFFVVKQNLHPLCSRPWYNLPDNVLKNTIIHTFKRSFNNTHEGIWTWRNSHPSSVWPTSIIHLCSHNPSNSNPITGGHYMTEDFAWPKVK